MPGLTALALPRPKDTDAGGIFITVLIETRTGAAPWLSAKTIARFASPRRSPSAKPVAKWG